MRRPGVLLALITTAGLTACGPGAGGVACPDLGQSNGVALTVAGNYAAQVDVVHLVACQDGGCHEADLELMPGSTSVDQGCTTDGVCSATASPDGTKVGNLDLGVLTESPITATVTGTAAGGALPVRYLVFKPSAGYPFGEQCPRYLSASVILDSAGLQPAS